MSTMASRRDILRLIGAGAAAVLARGVRASESQLRFSAGAVIRTVLKDLSPEALADGATLFHEHLSVAPDFMPKVMARELRLAAQDGVACIVDAGHPDMGRNLQVLKQLSMDSGMPIVAGCGYYTSPFYPPEIAGWSEERITQELLRQVRDAPVGAFGEIGTWDVMTPDERKVFRAVGRAHVASNLPIFTHTNMGKGALQQLDVLESVGVKPERVAIGHLGGLTDPGAAIPKALCKRGAFVGFDRQGGPGDAGQIPAVLALLEAGYASQLLFASDFSFASDLKRSGGAGYAKTVTAFAPKLRQAGVSDAVVHGMLVDNPRRLLAFVPTFPRNNTVEPS